jgi:WD40 repeat protein
VAPSAPSCTGTPTGSEPCAFTQDSRTLLTSGDDHRTVRIWDPVTATALLAAPVHHPVQAVDYASGLLVIALTADLLTIQLGPASSKS